MTADEMKAEIVRIAHWKSVAGGRDTKHVLRWHLPKVGATEEQIRRCEKLINQSIPSDFRTFLSLANGWPGFHVLTDLFGTDEISGQLESVMRRPDVEAFLFSAKIPKHSLIPIGASNEDIDLFLLVSDKESSLPGGVIWLAGHEVERFSTFSDFLSAMVNYNAIIAREIV